MAIFVKLWEKMVDMFKGIHNINLDGKGRLTIPTKYRNTITDQSNGSMVVTMDTEEKCLLLYPSTIWATIEKKINDLPSFSKNHRRIQRILIGHAEDLDIDSAGSYTVIFIQDGTSNIIKINGGTGGTIKITQSN